MLVFISETYPSSHNIQLKITECAANFLKFAPERIGGGGRGDN
jgi:hypothetical protein